MLLSYFSRRTLEADSRDSYGFAIRPQHLQAYKEYGKIYKEEEEQRSEKWSIFLEQCSEFAQTCTPAEEKSETSKPEATTGEGDESRSEKPRSDSWKEVGSRKEVLVVKERKRHNVKTWEPIRTSLSPIEKLMSVCVKKKAYVVNDRMHLVQKDQHPIDPEMPTRSNSHKSIQEQFTNNNVTCKENWNTAKAVAHSSESKHTSNDSHKKMDCSIVQDSEAKISANSCPNAIDTFVIHEPFFAWKEELESLVQVGVPKALRGEVWQAFIGVQTRRVEKYYQKLISTGVDICDTKNWRKQIEKDLPRTFPGHPALDEEGRNSLRRILTAYALHNPSVGYCQAMNFFAGLLLLLMPEENAFWALVGIIDDYFDGYFTHEMIESQVDQLVFDELMRERFPKLVKHLDYLGVEVAWVSGPWFLSIFINMLPWESVLRVWDVLLFEGNRVMLFRTALALMELYGPTLITTKDAGDAVTLFQSLAGSTFDSSQLVFTACIGFLAVTEAKLEELRRKHRPSVLGIIETRTKEKQLSKVASKLYSFSHRQSMRKESLRKESLRKEPKRKESLGGKLNGWTGAIAKLSPDNFDEFMCALSIDSESDSVPDLQEQVVRLKAELFQMMEEKRLATLRAEELETAYLEKSKQHDREPLIAKIEQLEQEVELLQQALADKQEQERATLQVLMRVEEEKKAIEVARNAVLQDLDAQKRGTYLLQKKYEAAMTALAKIEKGLTAESALDGAVQNESGDANTVSSSRGVCSNSLHEGGKIGVSSELGEHDASEE